MKNRIGIKYSPKALTIGILVLSSVLFAAWMFCARGYGKGWMDDFAYTKVYTAEMDGDKYFSNSGPEIQGLTDIFSSIYWHYMLLNGRLANFLMLFYSQLPSWLAAMLQGAAYGFMIAGIMRLGLGENWRRRPLALAGMVALVWFAFPWWDMHASADFMFNYVWSGAACLWSAVALFTPSQQGRLRWLWLVIPAAMMHEGFGAVLDVGILVYFFTKPKSYITRPRLLILPLVFGLCSLVPMLSPGIRQHASDVTYDILDTHYLLYDLATKSWPVLVACAVFIVWAVCKKQWRLAAVCLTMIVVTYSISIFALTLGRALWPAYLVAAVTLCRVCANIRIKPRLTAALALSVTALVSVWGIDLCRWQWRTSLERDAVLEEMRRGHPEGVYVMTPVTNYNHLPWWLFDIPGTVGAINPGHRAYIFAETYNDIDSYFKSIALMPAAPTLEESIESLPPLPSGLRGDKHHIVTRRRQLNRSFTLIFSEKPDPRDGYPQHVYSFRTFDAPVHCPGYCEEVGLRLSSGDSVYVYRPILIPRSLWNHPLIDAQPVK